MVRSSRRTLGVLSAVVMFCVGSVLAAAPVQAADTQFRLIFTGSRIPAYVQSVQVDFLNGDSRCVKNIKPGQDHHTGLNVWVPNGSAPGSQARRIWVVTFTNGQCAYPAGGGGFYREAPKIEGAGVHDWWIALS